MDAHICVWLIIKYSVRLKLEKLFLRHNPWIESKNIKIGITYDLWDDAQVK
jgi:hypothetical protein